VDAFDADALIYAAVPNHALGRRVLPLIPDAATPSSEPSAAIGSLLLLPELLTKPLRDEAKDEVDALLSLLARLELRPLDEATAELAVALGVSYGLKAADSVHLATAVGAGADRFVTLDKNDFPQTIEEIDVTYLEDLPDPAAA